MDSNVLRRIIKEQLEVAHSTTLGSLLKSSIKYIQKFKHFEYKKNNNKEIWFFANKIQEYTLKLYVINDSGNWKAKLQIFWKKESKAFTSGKGKDMEKDFGPFQSYEELIKDLNLKLHNNPMLSPKVFDDNWELNMDREVILLLKKLQKLGKSLMAVNDKYFDEIKAIYRDVSSLSDDKLLAYSQKRAPKEEDKQDLILDLQKMNKLDFYSSMEKMHK